MIGKTLGNMGKPWYTQAIIICSNSKSSMWVTESYWLLSLFRLLHFQEYKVGCLTDDGLVWTQWCFTPAACWRSLLTYYGVVVCSLLLIILDFPAVALMICEPATYCWKNKDRTIKLSRRSRWSQSCVKEIGRMVEIVHFRQGPTEFGAFKLVMAIHQEISKSIILFLAAAESANEKKRTGEV